MILPSFLKHLKMYLAVEGLISNCLAALRIEYPSLFTFSMSLILVYVKKILPHRL